MIYYVISVALFHIQYSIYATYSFESLGWFVIKYTSKIYTLFSIWYCVQHPALENTVLFVCTMWKNNKSEQTTDQDVYCIVST